MNCFCFLELNDPFVLTAETDSYIKSRFAVVFRGENSSKCIFCIFFDSVLQICIFHLLFIIHVYLKHIQIM